MKEKTAASMVSEQHKPATPEQIEEYRKLKARSEWIKFNQARLDDIEKHRLRSVRFALIAIILNLIATLSLLINVILMYYET